MLLRPCPLRKRRWLASIPRAFRQSHRKWKRRYPTPLHPLAPRGSVPCERGDRERGARGPGPISHTTVDFPATRSTVEAPVRHFGCGRAQRAGPVPLCLASVSGRSDSPARPRKKLPRKVATPPLSPVSSERRNSLTFNDFPPGKRDDSTCYASNREAGT